MKLNRWIYLLLFVACFVSCNNYEDGPTFSLRPPSNRMRFTRPITHYSVGGLDSLAGLLKLLQDNILGFDNELTFEFEPGELEHPIYCNDCIHFGIGTWSGTDPFDSIELYIAYQPFDACCWEVLRLSHRELWLRSMNSPVVRELRFEE